MQTIGEKVIVYKQKLALAQRLLCITELIKVHLERNKFGKVFLKLKKRSEIISRFKILENAGLEHRRIRKLTSAGITAPEEELLQASIKELKRIFEKVRDLDQQIKASILQEREKVSIKLNKASADHKLIDRYTPKEKSKPRFFRLSL